MIEQSLHLAVYIFCLLQERDVRYELITPPPGDMVLRLEIVPMPTIVACDNPYPGWKPPGNFPKGKRRWS